MTIEQNLNFQAELKEIEQKHRSLVKKVDISHIECPKEFGVEFDKQNEIHVFIGVKDDTNPEQWEDSIKKANQCKDEYNLSIKNYNDQLKKLAEIHSIEEEQYKNLLMIPMKMCELVLFFLKPSPSTQEEVPSPVHVLQSARYVYGKTNAQTIDEARFDASFFTERGFAYIRTKCEANLPTHQHLFPSDEKKEEQERIETVHKYYREFHIKCGIKENDHIISNASTIHQDDFITFGILCKELCQKYLIPIALSYNKQPHQHGEDQQGGQIFVNLKLWRCSDSESIVDEIEKSTEATHLRSNPEKSYRVIKTIKEWVWVDTYRGMDNGWLEFDSLSGKTREERIETIKKISSYQHIMWNGKDLIKIDQ